MAKTKRKAKIVRVVSCDQCGASVEAETGRSDRMQLLVRPRKTRTEQEREVADARQQGYVHGHAIGVQDGG